MWPTSPKVPLSLQNRMHWTPFLDREWRKEHVFSIEMMTQWGPVVEIRSNAQGQREVWLHSGDGEGSTLSRISASTLPQVTQNWHRFLNQCEQGGPYPPLTGFFRRVFGHTIASDRLWAGGPEPQLHLRQAGKMSRFKDFGILLSGHYQVATFDEFRAWLALLDRVCQMLNETTTAASDKTG